MHVNSLLLIAMSCRCVREEVQGNVRECAHVYHRLHQLHLMGHTSDSSHLLGLYLALTSINFGECGSVSGEC